MVERAARLYPKSASRKSHPVTFRLDLFDDFHVHGASAPQWNQRYIQLSRGEMRSSLAEASADGLHVFRKWMSERVVQQGRLPRGQICFALVGAGVHGVPRMQGREVNAPSLFVLRGDEEFAIQRPKGLELLAVTFDDEAWRRLLDGRPLSAHARAQLARPMLQAPPAAMQRLRRDLLGAFDAAAPRDPTLPIFDALSDLLERAGAGTPPTLASASASDLVARCHRLVAQSGDEPPGIDALCARLRTSRRTLQNSFRQVADTTPAHYLRSVRLDAVRRDLLATRATELSIAQAALGRGFNHLSRFSAHYRALFGELPSQTARA